MQKQSDQEQQVRELNKFFLICFAKLLSEATGQESLQCEETILFLDSVDFNPATYIPQNPKIFFFFFSIPSNFSISSRCSLESFVGICTCTVTISSPLP